jgi:hypothetical protein
VTVAIGLCLAWGAAWFSLNHPPAGWRVPGDLHLFWLAQAFSTAPARDAVLIMLGAVFGPMGLAILLMPLAGPRRVAPVIGFLIVIETILVCVAWFRTTRPSLLG